MIDAVSNAFERHTQTALVLLLVALLVWVGGTTQKTAVAVAGLRAEVAFIRLAMSRPHLHPEMEAIDLHLGESIDDLRKRVKEIEDREHERN